MSVPGVVWIAKAKPEEPRLVRRSFIEKLGQPRAETIPAPWTLSLGIVDAIFERAQLIFVKHLGADRRGVLALPRRTVQVIGSPADARKVTCLIAQTCRATPRPRLARAT